MTGRVPIPANTADHLSLPGSAFHEHCKSPLQPRRVGTIVITAWQTGNLRQESLGNVHGRVCADVEGFGTSLLPREHTRGHGSTSGNHMNSSFSFCRLGAQGRQAGWRWLNTSIFRTLQDEFWENFLFWSQEPPPPHPQQSSPDPGAEAGAASSDPSMGQAGNGGKSWVGVGPSVHLQSDHFSPASRNMGPPLSSFPTS